ncbi:MAG: SPFH domain-containing protein [Prolixibacteraceae bacterium]
MNQTVDLLIAWGWILPVLLIIVFYKWTFRLFGIWIIPEDKVGIVTKKFKLFGANKILKEGEIFACNGESGIQAEVLKPGVYFWYWPWQYGIDIEPLLVIEKGQIGLVQAEGGKEIPVGRILARKVECQNFQDAKAFLTNGGQKGRQTQFLTAGTYRINHRLFKVTNFDIVRISPNAVGIITILDGEPLEQGSIAGPHILGHNNFQDPDAFLANGGRRGLQEQVVLSGSYNFNPWFVNVEEIPMTEIPISNAGVVVSYVGPEGIDVSGSDFIHGNIVEKGKKGVWKTTLDPGKYPINTKIMRVEVVPTFNIVLNWANARTEAHNLDDKLCTITVRSKDGFKFNLDVSQIINISYTNAPMVIARFGSVKNLVSQVLEPTIGNYFRNSAQNSDVIDFLVTRSERQQEAKMHIKNVLDVYNVTAVDTLIGDIVPPEELMKTLTDRKIAGEQEKTFTTQKMAQLTKQDLEKQTAIANMQGQLVGADLGVEISKKNANAAIETARGVGESIKIKSEADAYQKEVIGKGEASATLAVGTATAEAYKLAVDAMGNNNFAQFKIIEEIGKNKVNIMPQVLIAGSGNGNGGSGTGSTIDALLGFEVLKNANRLTEGNTTKTE